MDNYTEKEAGQRYEKLSEGMREAMFSDRTVKHIADISDRYNLGDSQMRVLNEAIDLVVLNFINREKLSEHFEKRLHIDTAMAQAITKDVSTLILDPIKQSSKQPLPAQPEERRREETQSHDYAQNFEDKTIFDVITTAGSQELKNHK